MMSERERIQEILDDLEVDESEELEDYIVDYTEAGFEPGDIF